MYKMIKNANFAFEFSEKNNKNGEQMRFCQRVWNFLG
jgi:hypothetical protein